MQHSKRMPPRRWALTLDPGVPLASFGKAGLLPLDHTRIASCEFRFLEEVFEVRFVCHDALGNTMGESTGLAGGSSTADDRKDVKLAQETGDLERTSYPLPIRWQREVFV